MAWRDEDPDWSPSLLDSIPEGEKLQRFAELEPPGAVDIPAHTSRWCKILYFRERDHRPCSGGC